MNKRAKSTESERTSGMAKINSKVTNAMDPSAAMMSFFFAWRSAHTPEAKEMSICGMNEQTVRSAISVPEWVLRVRYQKREKDVTEVPNCDIP